MTNLKRVLSLALAAVMLMGMMVIGAGAKDAADFDDYNEVQYTEAMDVMVGLKIIDGDDKGQLNPTDNLTREQAAKIICYLLMGKEGADLLSAETAPFADVSATRWSAGYIAYCKSEGIISGIGNNKFNPTGNVTAAEFAKMLLGALGYESKNEGFTGSQWSINVTKIAQQAGLFNGDNSVAANLALTREEACLYSLNTLKADMVEYTGGVDVTTGGTTVTVGAVRTKMVNSAVTETIANDNVMQFAEQYFKSLKSVAATTAEGLTGYKWQYDNKDISAAYTDAVLIDTLDTEVATITKGQIYSNYTFDGTTVAVYVNGTPETSITVAGISVRGSKVKALDDYNGAVIKLYDVNKDGAVDTAVVTIAYLAEVTKVTEATAADDRKIDLKVYDVDTTSMTVTGVYSDDFAKGDFIMVVPSANTGDGFQEPTSMTAANVVSDVKVTAYSDSSVTFGGSAYSYSAFRNGEAKVAAYSFTGSYDFYLDACGNVVAAFVHTPGATALNYAYVTGYETEAAKAGSLIEGEKNAVAKVEVVYMDGTTAVVDYAITVAAAADATKNYENASQATIAKGDSYITTYDASGNAKYYKVTGNESVDGNFSGLYSYTLNDAGQITLSAKTDVTIGTTEYAATAVTTDAKTVVTDKGNAVVSIDNVAKYATSSTKLVTVTEAGVVTSYTGYANFPKATFTVETGTIDVANECAAVVYLTKDGILTDILVVDYFTASSTAKEMLVYEGTSYTAANDKGVSTTYYNFFNAEGKTVAYPVAGTIGSAAKGDIFAATITDGVATLGTKITASNAGNKIAVGTVSTIVDDYIVVDGVVVYLTDDAAVYNVVSTADSWTADSLSKDDTVVVSYTTDAATGINTISSAFITAEA